MEIERCMRCKRYLMEEMFDQKNLCRDCEARYKPHRVCKKCKRYLNLSEHFRQRTKTTYRHICKQCEATQERERKLAKKHP